VSSELLTAIAAIAAAVFSLVTLLVTGFRERHRDNRIWIRANLLEAAIEYLDSSWLTRQNTRIALRTRNSDPAWFGDLKAECWRQNTLKGFGLTKIRLLGNAELVAAAERLYDADNVMLDLAFGENCEPDDPRWLAARESAKTELKATLDAFRQTLALEGGAPLGSGHKADWHLDRALRARMNQGTSKHRDGA
jgi:hypothetical protein